VSGGLNKYTISLQQIVTQNDEMTATVVTDLAALVTMQDSQAESTAASEMYLSSLLPADTALECLLSRVLTQDNSPADNKQLQARTADQLYSFLLSLSLCQIAQRYPK